jgi:hypothetical protein
MLLLCSHLDMFTFIRLPKSKLRLDWSAFMLVEVNCLNSHLPVFWLTFVSCAVKVDEFLQDAEGLVTLGLMRSSSQLSFRVCFALETPSWIIQIKS